MLGKESKITTTVTAAPQRFRHANFISAMLDEAHAYHLMAGVQHIAMHAEHELPPAEFRAWLVDFVVYHRMLYRINRAFRIERPEFENLWSNVDKHLVVDYHAGVPGKKRYQCTNDHP
jgi:hypothetical protein